MPPAKIPRSSRSKRKTSEKSTPDLRVNLSPPQATRRFPANHFEPVPTQASTPFDHFAWPEVDPSAGSSALGLNASEFFYAPLPFDSDLVESMQSLSYLSEMHDTALPGTHLYTYLVSSNCMNAALFLRICMDETNAPRGFRSVPTTNGRRVQFVTSGSISIFCLRVLLYPSVSSHEYYTYE